MSDVAPQEPHVEKPKRNWRGWLKEYAIIVIGVLTALAAQQAAEWWQWHSEVAQARTALRAEMTDNNNRLFIRRIGVAPCLARQIKEADAILTALEEKRTPGKFTTFHDGLGALISDAEWQSQRASQVLTHFPRDELAVMSRYYATLPDFRVWLGREGDAWRELSGLQKPLAGLTASDLMRLRVQLTTAKSSLDLINLAVPTALRRSKTLGLPDAKGEPLVVENFCTMDDERFQHFMRTRPRAEFLKPN